MSNPSPTLLWTVAAAAGLNGLKAVAVATQEGTHAVLAGGASIVEHDCGFYLNCSRSTAEVLLAAPCSRGGSWSAWPG